MTNTDRKILLLGLGNDILADDGVGVVAVRLLKEQFQDYVDVVEASVGGFALLEILEGYEKALLLDAVATGNHPAGTILEFSRDDFQKVIAPSPHLAGIPEFFRLAETIGIPLPKDVRILAMEVEEPYLFREGLSPSVEKALSPFVESARRVLQGWRDKRLQSS